MQEEAFLTNFILKNLIKGHFLLQVKRCQQCCMGLPLENQQGRAFALSQGNASNKQTAW